VQIRKASDNKLNKVYWSLSVAIMGSGASMVSASGKMR
jgi:hypothetical protein